MEIIIHHQTWQQNETKNKNKWKIQEIAVYNSTVNSLTSHINRIIWIVVIIIIQCGSKSGVEFSQ